MNKSSTIVLRLNQIRNKYGDEFLKEKSELLEKLNNKVVKGKGALKVYYETLLFLIAYPDNKSISDKALLLLKTLEQYLKKHNGVAYSLVNSGVTGTQLCAAFSFEMVKWLRQTHKEDIYLENIEADDGVIRSVISVVMPKVESEILLDANAEWKEWLNKTSNKGEELLDKFLRVFDQTDLRPEVRDTLWDSLGINVTITFSTHTALPVSLTYPYYHKAIVKTLTGSKEALDKPIRIKLNPEQCEQIIDCARMILIRHEREIDPMTFTAPSLVSYYKLPRGFTIALFAMTKNRRQPIDSYMGYVAFKNGLPVGYGGSWTLFDSARLALNIFPAYRGGESRHTIEEIMRVHKHVYHLKRFTLDPYQIGKDNKDGIKSGAFWVYHHIGYRPIKEMQKKLAEEEAAKIKSTPGYRSSPEVLKKLADSRMEFIIKPNSVRFDAVDISIAYANILRKQYNNNRKVGEEIAFNKLIKLVGIKNYYEPNINFVLKNWAVILSANDFELYKNKQLKNTLKKLFLLKANGVEEDYIAELTKCLPLRVFMTNVISNNT